MKKKIALVTGGAGFIGSHMVDLLLSKNYYVRVIDDLSGGNKNNIQHCFKNKKFSFKKIDICRLKKNNKFFKNINYVFHFAGKGDVVPSIVDPAKYMQVNIQGTINVLEAARYNKIKKFIYAASSSCYGKTKGITNEQKPISLEHPYALSKYLAELAVLNWNKVFNLSVDSLRIFNAYGPRVRTTGAYGAVIGVFFKQKIENKPLTVVGNGKQKRDFVHVYDLAKAFLAAAENKKSKCGIYNVGTGKTVTINKLANILGGKVVKIPDRPGEPKATHADIKKIKRHLKWKPYIQFQEGINDMLKNLGNWKSAPLWTPKKIKKATKIWFKYLS